jgi:type III secretion protein R
MDASAGSDVFALFARLGFSVLALGALFFLALAFSSYVKIVTVLSIIRAGFGFDGVPSVFVGGVLALTLSLLVMYPTIRSSLDAMDKVTAGKGTTLSDETKADALRAGAAAWKLFIERQAGKAEKHAFARSAFDLDRSAGAAKAESFPEDPAAEAWSAEYLERWQVLAPAFVVTELKASFLIGFSIFLPLLLVDLLIANALLAVGYDQVSPHLVSFPFKLLLFVMIDGWSLITGNLVSAYVH